MYLLKYCRYSNHFYVIRSTILLFSAPRIDASKRLIKLLDATSVDPGYDGEASPWLTFVLQNPSATHCKVGLYELAPKVSAGCANKNPESLRAYVGQ